MFTQQKKDILTEFATFREEVIQKLNDAENKLIGDIDYQVGEETKEIKTFLMKIDEQIADMEQKLRDIDSMTSYGSDFQTFVGIKETIPTKVRIFREDKRQMQTPISSKESHLGLAQKFDIEEGSRNRSIRGCTFMPNGKFVFTDRNSQALIIHDNDGSFQYSIEGHGRVFDVAAIDNTYVAVTSGSEAVVYLYNIESKEVVKTTKTNGPCYGITFKSGIETITLSDNTISEFYIEALPWGTYITTVDDNICFVNHEIDIIKLLDSSSKVCWTFNYKHFLRDPRGVTSDNHGIIYLIGHTTNNVVSISTIDSMEFKQVLSMEDGLPIPTAVDFDARINSIMVVSWEGSVLVYNCN
ncbi:unnamed protein product [Mytilus edulis]|uniref:Uncharacterized protein n=1 Tax=Mytilus edulis TaxID=6550 RepID=A0A8S3UTL3_MYTED|nr:unnamed protein product [Mytilus edulis]